MQTNIVKVYIPRVLVNISKKIFTKTFMNRGIGKVVYTDIYKRENTDKDSSYKFAFINIKLFETETANEFLQSIQKSPIIKN